MLTVKITIRSDGFEFQGEAPFADVVALVDKFYVALNASQAADQATINRLRTLSQGQNDDLQAGVEATRT